MTGIVSVQQMKEIEKACNDMGIDYLRLMENAGSAAAAFIRKKADIRGRNCVVIAGKGHEKYQEICGQKGIMVVMRL